MSYLVTKQQMRLYKRKRGKSGLESFEQWSCQVIACDLVWIKYSKLMFCAFRLSFQDSPSQRFYNGGSSRPLQLPRWAESPPHPSTLMTPRASLVNLSPPPRTQHQEQRARKYCSVNSWVVTVKAMAFFVFFINGTDTESVHKCKDQNVCVSSDQADHNTSLYGV